MAEHLDARTAAAEQAGWAAGRVLNDLTTAVLVARRLRFLVVFGVQASNQAFIMLVDCRFDSRLISLVALPRAVFAARLAALS